MTYTYLAFLIYTALAGLTLGWFSRDVETAKSHEISGAMCRLVLITAALAVVLALMLLLHFGKS